MLNESAAPAASLPTSIPGTASNDVVDLQNQLAQQQRQIRELQQQLVLRDMALDSVPTHFAVSQMTESGGNTVYCNQAICDTLGYRREELLGTNGKSKLHGPKWSADRYREMHVALTEGREYSFEDEVSRRDGSKFWTGVTTRPIMDADGRVTHAVSIGADITEKRALLSKERELQEQLIAEMKERERILLELRLAQKLESVGRLAAGVAHEINTPIQYVGDSLYFLRSAFDDINSLIDTCREALTALPEDPAVVSLRKTIEDAAAKIDLSFLLDEVPKAFERTFEGTARVAGIVRAMKEFSHPDATEFSPADINHALQTTLTVATAEYKYLARVDTQFGELPQVNCNISELNQVFLNMIVNAAHAIQDAGKNTDGGVISIVTSADDEYVQIVFGDNGCGIPKENLDKIYDPFFTTKEVGRGTGQGLAITRSIVADKHGGEVQVSSEVGVGTHFTIRLPIDGRPPGAER